MATINLRIPDELRQRMDKAGGEIWSAIAQQAFESHLVPTGSEAATRVRKRAQRMPPTTMDMRGQEIARCHVICGRLSTRPIISRRPMSCEGRRDSPRAMSLATARTPPTKCGKRLSTVQLYSTTSRSTIHDSLAPTAPSRSGLGMADLRPAVVAEPARAGLLFVVRTVASLGYSYAACAVGAFAALRRGPVTLEAAGWGRGPESHASFGRRSCDSRSSPLVPP